LTVAQYHTKVKYHGHNNNNKMNLVFEKESSGIDCNDCKHKIGEQEKNKDYLLGLACGERWTSGDMG